jgi:hypothetical protein
MRYAPFALAVTLLAPAVAEADGLQVLVNGRPLNPHAGVAEPLRAGPTLMPAGDVRAFGRRYRRYRQEVNGVPVIGCGADETADADGKRIATDSRTCAAARTAGFTIGGPQAAAVASETIRSRGEPERLVVATPAARYYRRAADGALAPVWSVDVGTANPWGVWRIFVSGETGAVLRVTDLALRARGLVFPTGAAVDAGRPAMRPLPGIGNGEELTGPRVMVYDLTDALGLCPTEELFCAPANVRTCAARRRHGVFSYSPANRDTFGTCTAEDRFDQVTAYYQLAKMAAYFTDKVGWTPGTHQLAGSLPLPALANIPLFTNAFFAPPSDGWPSFLGFGDEFDPPQFLDFTRDPSVPRHEFGHAMIYDSGSALNDLFDCVDDCPFYAGAMHEALADYFAVASVRGRDTVVGGRLGENLVDAARDVVNDFRFPCDLTEEVHADGRIWAAFLFEVRKLLGSRTDALVFSSLLDLPHRRDLQFAHALDAFVRRLPALPERKTVRLVEAAVRRGLVGPWAYDRGETPVELDDGEAPWTCTGVNLCDVTGPDEAHGGEAAATVAVDESFTTGLAAYRDIGAEMDARGKTFVAAWVRPDAPVAAGSLALVLDDAPDCSSPTRVLDLPALTAGRWQQVFLRLDDGEDLATVACVGLVVAADQGVLQLLLDDIAAVTPSRFGPAVLTLSPGRRLALRNRFPAPFGDAHFYYFAPPPGATHVTVRASASGASSVRDDLVYCGNVVVSGEGTVPPELNNAFLWVYDPTQFSIPAALTPLPMDQHLLATGIPAAGRQNRRMRRFPLPASPTGIYAVSVQGSGRYRLKLAFQ